MNYLGRQIKSNVVNFDWFLKVDMMFEKLELPIDPGYWNGGRL